MAILGHFGGGDNMIMLYIKTMKVNIIADNDVNSFLT